MISRAVRAVPRLIKSALPHGIVLRHARWKTDVEQRRVLAERKRRLGAAQDLSLARDYAPFSYEAAVTFLVERGCDEEQVREGSMPEESLLRCGELMAELLPGDPLNLLHIGNFVGVSLATLSDLVERTHPGSIIWSIDPGVPHRGIARPQEHAMALLEHFGLQRSNAAMLGYTLEKNVGNDASPELADWEQLVRDFHEGAACEDVLPSLRALAQSRFDVGVIDGNHDASYLRRELAELRELLRPGGLLVLDDVSARSFRELRELFEEVVSDPVEPFELVEEDGRVAVLAKQPRQPGG
jgi:hypothetical protein